MSFIHYIKDLVPNFKLPQKKDSDDVNKVESPANELEAALNNKIDLLLNEALNENAVDEKKRAYLLKGREVAPDLISKAGNEVFMITAGLNLAPGVVGLITILPELYYVLKIQIGLVRDLSIAYGYKEKLNKELLTYLFAASLGTTGIGLATMHGAQILLKRPGIRVIDKMVSLMAGKITQGVLKSAVTKWLPIVGAAVLAAWSRYSTQQIGKLCCKLLEKEIVISDQEVQVTELIAPLDTEPDLANVKLESFKVLINLAIVDGVSEEESSYIISLLEHSELSASEIEGLKTNLSEAKSFDINFELFKNDLDNMLLTENLDFISKLDGVVSESEGKYIAFIHRQLVLVNGLHKIDEQEL